MYALILIVALLSSASAFAPARVAAKAGVAKQMQMSIFDDAVNDWKRQYPSFYAKGWGPTTKAERWNGRHAM